MLVLDDLHDLCPHRDLSPSEEERRATASLATLMDQLNRTPPPAHVVVMATTNQIERVESSLRRPGRFDKEVEISVPTASERKEVKLPYMVAYCDLLSIMIVCLCGVDSGGPPARH